MTEITMDSDAGHALLWLAAMGPGPMHYRELAAQMWPDGRDIRFDAAVNRLILAGLAEVDPDKGEGWARVTIAGADLAKTWGMKP